MSSKLVKATAQRQTSFSQANCS